MSSANFSRSTIPGRAVLCAIGLWAGPAACRLRGQSSTCVASRHAPIGNGVAYALFSAVTESPCRIGGDLDYRRTRLFLTISEEHIELGRPGIVSSSCVRGRPTTQAARANVSQQLLCARSQPSQHAWGPIRRRFYPPRNRPNAPPNSIPLANTGGHLRQSPLRRSMHNRTAQLVRFELCWGVPTL
jgi:hypothetical protein